MTDLKSFRYISISDFIVFTGQHSFFKLTRFKHLRRQNGGLTFLLLTIVDRSLIRERVQMSPSSHADADQSGANLIFPILFSIGTEWKGISNGSKFFIGQINRSHQILTYICQRLSKGWNRWSRYVTDKNYIRQCLCRQKQSVNDWVDYE